MQNSNQEKLCLYETKDAVTSISTMDFVPQPLDEKSHFIRNRIFVGNFSDFATQKDINCAFRPFGKIIETNIIDSSNSTGRYGFVTFENIDSADAVLCLYSRGREFRVRGEVVTINHALFKPKKRATLKPMLASANGKSYMMCGGRTVMTEYINGMAYFQPLKDENALCSQVKAALQKQKMLTTGVSLPITSPGFQLTNQFRFPANYAQSVPLFRYPTFAPPRIMCGILPTLPPSVRSNLQTLVPTPQIPPCYSLPGSCFGALPVIH